MGSHDLSDNHPFVARAGEEVLPRATVLKLKNRFGAWHGPILQKPNGVPQWDVVKNRVFHLFDEKWLSIWNLQGDELVDRYVEWVLPEDLRAEQRFWREIGLDESLLESNLIHPRRRIFVNALKGSPVGPLIIDLVSDKRFAKGLFIASRGHRNAVPCIGCERTLKTTIMDVGLEAPVRAMTPFAQCISLEGVSSFDCCNCAWHSYSDCVFRDTERPEYEGRDDIEAMRGRSDRSGGGIPRNEALEWSERNTKLSSDEVVQELEEEGTELHIGHRRLRGRPI